MKSIQKIFFVLILFFNSILFCQTSGWDSLSTILSRIIPPSFPNVEYNIMNYGAVEGGLTDCTDAIKNAINECSSSGGGKVVIPAGKFLTGAIYIKCNVNLHLSQGSTLLFTTDKSKYLPVVYTRYEGIECMNYSPFIYAFGESNIAITGSGTLDGQAGNNNWWDWKNLSSYESNLLYNYSDSETPVEQRTFGSGHYLRPNFIQPYKCNNVLIDGITILRSPMWEVHPVLSTNVTVSNITVNSYGPNNDGCNPESCTDVLIKDCYFNTGDDCIAIKSGRNTDGRRVNVPSQNIVIQDCQMVDGHGGITMGSEMSGGIRNVYAENCEMTGTNLNNVIRFKTNSLRGGYIENVYVRNITSSMDKQGAVRIEMTYQGETGNYLPVIRNIFIDNLQSNKSLYAVYITDTPQINVKNLQLTNCTFNNVTTPYNLNNSTDVVFKNVTINGVLYTDVKNENGPLINDNFVLEQNYPNPFNPSTTINFTIPTVGDAKFASPIFVLLNVYDILGREIKTLVNEPMFPGNYEIKFDAKNLAAGFYFYSLKTGNKIQSKKMIILK